MKLIVSGELESIGGPRYTGDCGVSCSKDCGLIRILPVSPRRRLGGCSRLPREPSRFDIPWWSRPMVASRTVPPKR